MERGRAAAADFTGAEPEGIAFGANMTTLNFLLAHAVARTLEPGDEIVVTQLDHDANISPWLLMAGDHDLAVRFAPIRTEDVTLDHDALEVLIGERTRVVAFTTGLERGRARSPTRPGSPPPRTGSARWPGPTASTYAPHRRLRAGDWGLDVLLCSPYKFFGPHLGIAADPAATWPSRCPPTACGPPTRSRRGTASRRAPSRTRRWPAPPRPWSTCARWATAISTWPSSASRRTRRP